ncbi:peptidase S9 [Polymorphobacter multimanifer]|nr:S9 family peptidase [Polymorphobacter multimanifer]GGI68404.1 peptidase S9 [Polymorphobacter multimanifer]
MLLRGIVVPLLLSAAPVAAVPDIKALATAYGTREAASSMRISPDGKQVLYFVAAGSAGTAVKVGDIETGESRIALVLDSAVVQPIDCGWKSSTRLLCRVYALDREQVGTLVAFQRTFSVAADGAGSLLLGPRANSRSIGRDYGGARVIDWLPDDPEHVLMEVNVVDSITINTNIPGARPGLSVQKVNVLNNRATIVEPGNRNISDYRSDGHGNVRFRSMVNYDPNGYVRDRETMSVRPKGSRDWQELDSASLSESGGPAFQGFDESGDAALVTRTLDGRAALYRQPLASGAPAELIFAHPIVDADFVWRIGKHRRPVAVAYTVDALELAFFDEALKKRAEALTRALPGKPPVSIIDESWDGRYQLVFAGGVTDPGRYYRFDTQGRELTEVLPVRPQVAEIPVAPQRAVRFPAADGTMIPGYLTLPPGKEDARGLPAIVMPHGGPASRDALGFDWLAQFFAQAGYAVLQPNFRGSSGYGEAWYATNGFKSWEIAIGDVNAGARWLLGQGIADKNRMAIFGWSYGGYAALQANVLDPTLYKAVIAVAPVTDLGLMKASARFNTYGTIINRFFGEGPHILAGSPARQAERIGAPTLIFHGDHDLNVDVMQGKVMATALAKAGKKHELVVYPKLAHSLDDSTARIDLLTHSAAWLEAALR